MKRMLPMRIMPSMTVMSTEQLGALFLVVGVIAGVVGSFYSQNTFPQMIDAFYANLGTEFVSIGLTVLVIDRVVRQREELQRKEQLIRQMRNKDNGLALAAVEDLIGNGWLYDGTLDGANLHRANLEKVGMPDAVLTRTNLRGAVLHKANMSRADLSEARLRHAYMHKALLTKADLTHTDLRGTTLTNAELRGADLRGANIEEADLEGALLQRANLKGVKNLSLEQIFSLSRLWQATMPDGSMYDGRYRLAGDIEVAVSTRRVLDDPNSMAAYYGVSVEAYMAGQRWAEGQQILP